MLRGYGYLGLLSIKYFLYQHSQVRCPTFTDGVSVGAVLSGIPCFTDKHNWVGSEIKPKMLLLPLAKTIQRSPSLGLHCLSVFPGLSWQMEGVRQALCRHHRTRFGTARNWIRIRTEKATSTTDEPQEGIYCGIDEKRSQSQYVSSSFSMWIGHARNNMHTVPPLWS